MSLTALVAIGLVGIAPAQSGSSDYRLTYTTVGGDRLQVRWNPCQTITYRVNATFLSRNASARSAGIRDVQTAMSRLTSRTGIPFRYEGTTSQVPRNTSTASWWERQTGAEVVVAWVRQGSATSRSNLLVDGAAATGGIVWKSWSSTGRMRHVAVGRGFVVLDATRDLPPGFGSGVTRGALLLHELGHVASLRHVGARSEIMYATLLARSSAAYRSGDRAGLLRAGRAAGCITVPGYVWTQA